MLCLGQERHRLFSWSPAQPSPVSCLCTGKGKNNQPKTDCKTCEALSAHAMLRCEGQRAEGSRWAEGWLVAPGLFPAPGCPLTPGGAAFQQAELPGGSEGRAPSPVGMLSPGG